MAAGRYRGIAAGTDVQGPRPHDAGWMTRRITPALVMVFLAPFVAEVLLGNTPLRLILIYLIVLPMYGFGALFIRELSRRLGRGWPTILILGVAYGVAEEGLADMSLFNPNYLGQHLLSYGNVFGVGWPWWFFVLTLHAVWSIGVSIALAEALFPRNGEYPWLTRKGLVISGVLFVLGLLLVHFAGGQGYQLSAGQLALSLVLIAVIAAAAFLVPRRRASQTADPRHAPNPWLAGGVAFVLTSAFMAVTRLSYSLKLPAAVLILAYFVLYGLALWAVWRWSRRIGLECRARVRPGRWSITHLHVVRLRTGPARRPRHDRPGDLRAARAGSDHPSQPAGANRSVCARRTDIHPQCSFGFRFRPTSSRVNGYFAIETLLNPGTSRDVCERPREARLENDAETYLQTQWNGRRDQPMITLPMTPVAESSPITVSAKVAAIALPTHSRLLPAPRTIHPSAPNPSPSSRNHGSLKNRSWRSAVRRSIDAHTVAGYSMCSSPARLRTRSMISIKACMLQPTATNQHTASRTGLHLGLRHNGSTAIGNTAAIVRTTTAAALMSLNCLGSARVPGSKSVPPSA
jgi:hypothetical protein